MGAIIRYSAVPEGVPSRDAQRAAQIGFGRRVPVALGPMLAPDRDREQLRRAAASIQYCYYVAHNRDPRFELAAAGRWPWCEPMPPVALMWGGPPGTVDERGVARLSAVDVAEVAADLNGHDEAWLRAAYAREHAFIGTILDETGVLHCHALLRDFFAVSVASASEVVIWWELG